MPTSPLIRLSHSWLDDGHALVAGSLFVALGMTMFAHAGLLTGGVAEIAPAMASHRQIQALGAIGLEPSADVVVALFNDGASADGAAPLLGGRGFIEVRWRRDD